MKKLFFSLTAAAFALIFSACSSVDYHGETLPSLSWDAPVAFYLASDLQKLPNVRVLGTAEYTARSTLNMKEIREVLRGAARDVGANGIRIVKMEKIPSGEARKDQINNTAAPQWNVSDNSDTSLSYMKDTINYSDVRDPEKTIYKTFVKAEFLSVPTGIETVKVNELVP